MPLIKDAQILPNLPEIQAILPTHVIVILTTFHKDRSDIVDFLLLAYFGASVIFFVTVSKVSFILQIVIYTVYKLDNFTYQGLRNRFKSRGQSVMNFSKWGQNTAHFSKSMGAVVSFSKIEGSI